MPTIPETKIGKIQSFDSQSITSYSNDIKPTDSRLREPRRNSSKTVQVDSDHLQPSELDGTPLADCTELSPVTIPQSTLPADIVVSGLSHVRTQAISPASAQVKPAPISISTSGTTADTGSGATSVASSPPITKIALSSPQSHPPTSDRTTTDPWCVPIPSPMPKERFMETILRSRPADPTPASTSTDTCTYTQRLIATPSSPQLLPLKSSFQPSQIAPAVPLLPRKPVSTPLLRMIRRAELANLAIVIQRLQET